MATSDLAKEAALKAIAQAGITPEDIGFIVVGTTTPDTIFPSTACLVQHKIGATRAWGFDLGAACSGFTYALTTAAQMIASGASEHALVIGADVMSSIIDYTDRTTCVLFGDGAGAVGAVAGEPISELGILGFECGDRRQRRLRSLHAGHGRQPPASGVERRPSKQRLHYVKQDGQAVFRFAVRKTEEMCGQLLSPESAWASDIDLIGVASGEPAHHPCRRPRGSASRQRKSSSTSRTTATRPRPLIQSSLWTTQ